MKTKDKANHLVGETSTYLRQHAYNPVEWYPWGPEALERSKTEDKPILLSVGYAACHWCHVMEHESFEDEATAELMNSLFINIKVDREERTDIDEIYMKAVQLMTGHGGWPMTVFLAPDLRPFFGGTYFPKEDRHGLPSFKRVLKQVHQAWVNNRTELLENAGELSEHLKQMEQVKTLAGAENGKDHINYATINSALEKLLRNFDPIHGGFGGAPKFPHTFAIELAMRSISMTSQVKASRKDECRVLVETTLDQMAYGGIHDQIGGGFARYSVDRQWLVPHFEKMLYDNALLARTYFDGYSLTGKSYYLRVAEGILAFVERELSTGEGGFYSSLDADSEGVEGKFYVFTRAEIDSVLKKDADFFSKVFGVTESGNFEHGNNVLHLAKSPEKLSKELNMHQDKLFSEIERLSKVLLAYREKRVRPGLDQKVLTSWNSLMISAFVHGYQVTGKETYLSTARNAMNFILEKLMKDGRLLRVWGKARDNKGKAKKEGLSKLDGYLDDYAYCICALLDLASVDGEGSWLSSAVNLTEKMLSLFSDGDGGFFYTGSDHEELIVKPRSHFDGSVPSGTSVLTMDLLRLSHLLASEDYEKKAEAVLTLYGPHLTRMPDQFSNLLNAIDFYLSQPKEIAVVSGDGEDMLLGLYKKYAPGKVVVVKGKGQENPSPLFDGRSAIEGKTTIYVCQNFACQKPIVAKAELEEEIATW